MDRALPVDIEESVLPAGVDLFFGCSMGPGLEMCVHEVGTGTGVRQDMSGVEILSCMGQIGWVMGETAVLNSLVLGWAVTGDVVECLP